MSETKELTVIDPNSALEVFDYGEDAGGGFENQTNKDLQLPWLKLLQGLSPEVTKSTVDGAKPGLWMNTVTKEVYPRDKGFLFVWATTSHKFGIWTPRKEGGGFHGHLEIDDPRVLKAVENAEEFGQYKDPADPTKQLVECHYVFGVLCDEDGYAQGMAVIPFKGTAIKPYRSFNTRLDGFRLRAPGRKPQKPPLYAHLTRITSEEAKNKKGEFYIPKFQSYDPRGLLWSLLKQDDERFQLAKTCCEQQNEGKLKVDYEKSGADDESGATGSGDFA